MVCDSCANELHADCENVLKGTEGERATWCDCQHRESAIHTNSVVNRNRSEQDEAIKGNSKADTAEKEESENQS